MGVRTRKLLTKQSVEFELAATGVALAALFVGPMWIDLLHNNWPAKTLALQLGIATVCSFIAALILARLLWVNWE